MKGLEQKRLDPYSMQREAQGNQRNWFNNKMPEITQEIITQSNEAQQAIQMFRSNAEVSKSQYRLEASPYTFTVNHLGGNLEIFAYSTTVGNQISSIKLSEKTADVIFMDQSFLIEGNRITQNEATLTPETAQRIAKHLKLLAEKFQSSINQQVNEISATINGKIQESKFGIEDIMRSGFDGTNLAIVQGENPDARQPKNRLMH